ncbi:MAG: BglG family transcription antiterminator [Anaerorhabdus sp.]|uniref:BglG family transcription antiterminator n=1 Tax=Anaerorhabdus sp. TaxID=1872524 RepID=UPI003A8B154B
MKSLTTRQKSILTILQQNQDYLTAQDLATSLGVSVRTIKTDINAIVEELKDSEFEIESKNGRGYFVINKNVDNIKLQETATLLEDVPNDIEERISYVIRKLLVVDYHIKVDDLAMELFISRSSLNQILKEVRNKLLKYRLKLISRAKYGILVEGNEIDKRLAISEYFFHSNVRENYEIENDLIHEKSDYREEYIQIANYIRTVCDDYRIDMSDYSINNLVIHVNIAINRCKFYNYAIVNENILLDIQNTIEFKAANELVKEIEKKNHFLMPIGEVVYFAQHLRSKRILDRNRISSDENNKLESCIRVIFSEINNNFELNLLEDSELYGYLFLHIPQMITRLRYHMTIRNPLVNDHMRRYLFATKVTHSACAIIEQFYEVKVDQNEFGYLLLYFNLAITRFETNKQITIGILTGRGRPEALMYFNEISEHFSSHKYKIVEIDTIESNMNFDLIISTYKLEKSMNFPIFVITNDNYIEKIREKINEIRYHDLDIDRFFKEEYCYFDLDGDTKEEVLTNFYKVLYEREIIKDIPTDYNGLIDDELGNGIAHLQDSYRIVRKSLCFLCSLKKPIYWDKNMVRILVLTKTKKECDKDLYNLCRIVSKWANDIKKVSDFIKDQRFETLMDGIKKI